MLDISFLRLNKESSIQLLEKRGIDAKTSIDTIIELDNQRKVLQGERDDLLSMSNKIAKDIGKLYKEGKTEEASSLKKQTAIIKTQSKEKEADEDNEVIKTEGNIPTLDVKKGHWDIATEKDIIDFKLGVKITGAGFPVYKGKGAKLQRALIQYFLDEAEKKGFNEIQVPIVINELSGYGTGQLPDKEGQMYYMEKDDLYLIPTGEVPITNIYRDTIIKESDLPIKMVGYTPCFRREAGSYGKDVKGLNRLHQFDKVEIVQIEEPSKSYETLIEMRDYIETLIKNLNLPYRILNLCGGDLGFTSAQTFDFEVYSAGQDMWLEVSSVSNFETYQSNRLKLRYKKDGKSIQPHTLNGSALALPRILATIIENNYKDGEIIIPKVLVPYTKFTKI
jgi:seryl-tRNA synthetase